MGSVGHVPGVLAAVEHKVALLGVAQPTMVWLLDKLVEVGDVLVLDKLV